jgi:DNA-binding transcriptional ArsR family regulator
MLHEVVGVATVPASLIWSMPQIAARDGISKQAVQKTVARLIEAGNITDVRRDGRGRVTGINVAEYDSARGTNADPAKLQGAETTRQMRGELPLATAVPSPAAAPSEFTQANTLRAQYDAKLKELDLAKQLRLVLPRDQVIEAQRKVLDAIVSQLNQLLSLDEDLIVAAKESRAAVRALLKKAIFETRRAAAAALRELEAEGRAEKASGPVELELEDELAGAA